MPKKMSKKGQAEVHKDLEGFNIKIDPFGKLRTNFEIDRLNEFLNENIEDKKLNHLINKLNYYYLLF